MWKSNVDTSWMTYLQDSCVLNQSSVFSFRPTSKTTMSSAAGAVSGKRLSDGQVRRPLDKREREREREAEKKQRRRTPNLYSDLSLYSSVDACPDAPTVLLSRWNSSPDLYFCREVGSSSC